MLHGCTRVWIQELISEQWLPEAGVSQNGHAPWGHGDIMRRLDEGVKQESQKSWHAIAQPGDSENGCVFHTSKSGRKSICSPRGGVWGDRWLSPT